MFLMNFQAMHESQLLFYRISVEILKELSLVTFMQHLNCVTDVDLQADGTYDRLFLHGEKGGAVGRQEMKCGFYNPATGCPELRAVGRS